MHALKTIQELSANLQPTKVLCRNETKADTAQELQYQAVPRHDDVVLTQAQLEHHPGAAAKQIAVCFASLGTARISCTRARALDTTSKSFASLNTTSSQPAEKLHKGWGTGLDRAQCITAEHLQPTPVQTRAWQGQVQRQT